MKRLISVFCCICLLAAALFSFGACGKQMKKNLDEVSQAENAGAVGSETLPLVEQTNDDGERLAPPVYPNVNGAAGATVAVTGAPVTDAAGAPVTDAAGVTVTTPVTAAVVTNAADGTPVATDSAAVPTGPALKISCDKKKDLKVGDTVTVTVGVQRATWLTTLEIYLYYDSNYLGVQKIKSHPITDLITETNDVGEYVKYASMAMRTVDVPDNDLFTVTFVVNKQPSGNSKITYATANVFQWIVGNDENGDSTTGITGTVPPVEVALHIDG